MWLTVAPTHCIIPLRFTCSLDALLTTQISQTPQGASDIIYRSLSIYWIGLSYHKCTHTDWRCALSIVICMMFTTP